MNSTTKVFLIVAILLYTCANSFSQNEDDGDSFYLQSGFELMKNEKLGELKIGMPLNKLIKLMGEPQEKTETQFWDGDANYHQTYNYKDLGIHLDLKGESEEQKQINMITIYKPCNYKTKKEIGLGSSFEEVYNAYEKYIDVNFLDTRNLVAGSIYGGIIFSFEENKVVSIFIGAAAE